MIHDLLSYTQVMFSGDINLRDITSRHIIHCPYYVNFYNKDKNSLERSINTLTGILKTKCSYIVMHMGSYDGDMLSYKDRCLLLYNSIPLEDRHRILLENSAGQGNVRGYNSNELIPILSSFRDFGVCIDTQHSFAGGLIDFRDNWLKPLHAIVSTFNVRVLHLNDSKVKYGSRVDRHENLKQGYIWKNNKKNLYKLIHYCLDHNIIIVCETPDDESDMEMIREMFTE